MGLITLLYGGMYPGVKSLNGEYHVPWVRVGTPRSNNPAFGKELWKWLKAQVEGRVYLVTIQAKVDLGISIELAKCTRSCQEVNYSAEALTDDQIDSVVVCRGSGRRT